MLSFDARTLTGLVFSSPLHLVSRLLDMTHCPVSTRCLGFSVAMEKAGPLDSLPLEICEKIFGRLSRRDRLNLSSMCRQMRALFNCCRHPMLISDLTVREAFSYGTLWQRLEHIFHSPNEIEQFKRLRSFVKVHIPFLFR